MINNFDTFVENKLFEQAIFESEQLITDVLYDENLTEARKQILRKYGERSRISIYEKAHLRNSIILGIGNKQLTLEQLKSLFNKVEEDRGKTVNGKIWFKQNRKYFKESGGIFKLSKLGKRIYTRLLEMDYEKKMSKLMKKNFSVNESKIDKLVKKGQEIEYTGSEIEVWKSKDGKLYGQKIKIKKGAKGTVIRHNAGKNYYVEFDDAKFYLNDSDFK